MVSLSSFDAFSLPILDNILSKFEDLPSLFGDHIFRIFRVFIELNSIGNFAVSGKLIFAVTSGTLRVPIECYSRTYGVDL